jgi:riboflavin synthase
MFTGLVEALGQVEEAKEEASGRRLRIVWQDLREPFPLGASVAVNGCCLTVVATSGNQFEVQVGPETLLRTNLREKHSGDLVNLERSLRVGDSVGGHFLQGHIDTTARLRQRRREGDWEYLTFTIKPEWTTLMIPQGSIAVDGVSLTLVMVEESEFSVMIIPHTSAVTTLGRTPVGTRVNIEVDMLAKHVAKLLAGKLKT